MSGIPALDSRTRDSHREMDGQVADKDGIFHPAEWSENSRARPFRRPCGGHQLSM